MIRLPPTTCPIPSPAVNVGPAVHSANVIPSAAKPASAVTAPAEDGAANTAVNVGLLVDPFQPNYFDFPSGA